jgi:hypothetical protein
MPLVREHMVSLTGLELAASSLSGIDGRALGYPAFPLVMRLRKSYKDGVNPLSAAEPGRTRLPERVTTQASGFTRLTVRPTAAAHRSAHPTPVSTQERTAAGSACWVSCWTTRTRPR